MNVVDADRRNNSHFDIPKLQQTQILPYYGCRYGLKFDLEYNLSSKTFFSEIDAYSICPDIVSLAGVVVVTWALCV